MLMIIKHFASLDRIWRTLQSPADGLYKMAGSHLAYTVHLLSPGCRFAPCVHFQVELDLHTLQVPPTLNLGKSSWETSVLLYARRG